LIVCFVSFLFRWLLITNRSFRFLFVLFCLFVL
jgi:hypothetical protein